MSDHTQQQALRVLMVEDSANDAELIVDTLTEGGFVVDCLRLMQIRAVPYTDRLIQKAVNRLALVFDVAVNHTFGVGVSAIRPLPAAGSRRTKVNEHANQR